MPYERFPGDPLAGVTLQRDLEQRAFRLGGSCYAAPAQRLQDFLEGSPSADLGCIKASYQPGVTPSDLSGVLPEPIIAALREALPAFAARLQGYDHPDAVLTGPITLECLEPIAGRDTEIFESLRRTQLTQLAQRDSEDPRIDRAHAFTVPQPLGLLVAERSDHDSSV